MSLINIPKKIDFFCIGAQKSGTTTLHDLLIQHPDIYLPPKKEAQFFDVNERYSKGLDYYFSTYFDTYIGERVVGNINPNLQLDTRSVDRIIECFGKNIKLIFVIRDPVKRAFSHYQMSKRRGYENLSFIMAMEMEEERLLKPKSYNSYITSEPMHFEKNHFGYKYRSTYSRTIKYLFNNLSKENIKIIIFEQFVKNKIKHIDEIFEFIDVDKSININFNIKSNVATTPKIKLINNLLYNRSKKIKFITKLLNNDLKYSFKKKLLNWNTKRNINTEEILDPVTYETIQKKYFESEIRELEILLGNNFQDWKYS